MTEKKEIKDVAVLTIQTDCARAEEIAGQYFFDRKQKELLKELLATGLFEFTNDIPAGFSE